MQLLYAITTAMMMCVSVCVNAVHLPHLRDTVAAEAWTSIPDTNITFSSTFCCNETRAMDNVMVTIEALRFCFTDVVLIIDVPHDGPGGYSEFLNSTWGTQMIATANKTAQAAVALLQSRCPLSLDGPLHPLTWKVDVLNYDDPAMRTAFESDFGVDTDGWIFGSIYKNTMAYIRSWHLPDTQYVWHSDADIQIYRIAEGASPNFIEASINLLRSDSRVVATKPTDLMSLQLGENALQSKFDAHTYTMIREPGAPAQFIAEAFLLDAQKFKSLLPLPAGGLLQEQTIEHFLRDSFEAKGVFQVDFDCSTNIIAGYQHSSLLFAKSKCNTMSEMLG